MKTTIRALLGASALCAVGGIAAAQDVGKQTVLLPAEVAALKHDFEAYASRVQALEDDVGEMRGDNAQRLRCRAAQMHLAQMHRVAY